MSKSDDTISRQDAIECIRWGESVTDIIDRINALPSADIEEDVARRIATIIENEQDMRVILKNAEPKTGKWELDPNGMDWNIPAWRCSECGFVANYIGVEANGLGNNPMNWSGSKFCPQCGARITGYER